MGTPIIGKVADKPKEYPQQQYFCKNMVHATVYLLIPTVFECLTHYASYHAHEFVRITLHAYNFCIPVQRHASHLAFISYAKHDDDCHMSLSIVSKQSGLEL